MRLLSAICCALSILAIGVLGEAWAACCTTFTPVHVYVPPPTHVVIVPHTTYVRPMTPQVHVHTPSNTSRPIRSSTPSGVQAKPTPRHKIVQSIIVNDPATTRTRCKQSQSGDGCKKKEEEQTGWATVRRWLQLDKH